jgi:hypothetical protein
MIILYTFPIFNIYEEKKEYINMINAHSEFHDFTG